jgi:hypothetical protein
METDITNIAAVWHKVDPDNVFRRYRPGDQLRRVFLCGLTPAETANPSETAELIWAAFNGAPSPAWEERSQRYYEAGIRSLSVGDVIIIGAVPMAVASVGFEQVEVSP